MYSPMIALAPLLLVGWAVVAVKQATYERVYVPAGKTKKEVQQEIDSRKGGGWQTTRSRGGDEFWRAAGGGKIIYARFRRGKTVEYGR